MIKDILIISMLRYKRYLTNHKDLLTFLFQNFNGFGKNPWSCRYNSSHSFLNAYLRNKTFYSIHTFLCRLTINKRTFRYWRRCSKHNRYHRLNISYNLNHLHTSSNFPLDSIFSSFSKRIRQLFIICLQTQPTKKNSLLYISFPINNKE